jgi:hypothetical protein
VPDRSVADIPDGSSRLFVVTGAYAANMPDVRGGEYSGPHLPGELWGHPTRVGSSRLSKDVGTAAALSELATTLTCVALP